MVCDCVDCSNDDEVCWWLGTAAGSASNNPGIRCRTYEGRMVEMKIGEIATESNPKFCEMCGRDLRGDDQ